MADLDLLWLANQAGVLIAVVLLCVVLNLNIFQSSIQVRLEEQNEKSTYNIRFFCRFFVFRFLILQFGVPRKTLTK